MRWLLVSCMSIVLLGMYFADQPAHWMALSQLTARTVHRVFFEKRIQSEGVRVLAREEVLKLLPEQRSALWWAVNLPVIESQLRRSALIEQAKVTVAGWKSFVVHIKERRAEFFVLVGSEGWLVGQDGGTIMPLSRDEVARLSGVVPDTESAGLRRLPVVTGLVSGEISPDVMRSRFEHVRRALDVLQHSVGLPVEHLHLRQKKEIEVKFRGFDFRAIFELPIDQDGTWDAAVLRESGLRLQRIMSELGNLVVRVNQVDLAFDRLAVVSWKDKEQL